MRTSPVHRHRHRHPHRRRTQDRSTAIWCALLAAAAWTVHLRGPGQHAALVFAVVWTAMAVTYGARARHARREVKHPA